MASRLRARMIHRVLAFAVEYVQIDADNLRVTYLQEREPGPLPDPHSHLEGRDSAEVVIRRLLLLPDARGAPPPPPPAFPPAHDRRILSHLPASIPLFLRLKVFPGILRIAKCHYAW